MDLNYLYQRHQISLMRADAALSTGARVAHRGLAAGYARLIEAEHQHDRRDRPAPLRDRPLPGS